MKYLIKFSFLCLVFFTKSLFSQDINASVQVIAPTLQAIDKNLILTLQNNIQQFLNSTKWTTEDVSKDEKLELSIFIEIKSITNITNYAGSLQIQTSRPVFNSTYKSPIFSFNDEEISFKYTEMEPLVFQENQNINDLTTLLAFYVYTSVGYDEESFGSNGGADYFKKAQGIVNLMQGKAGWGNNNGKVGMTKFNLIDNLTSQRFISVRELITSYHRKGLDQMYDNATEARKNITDGIKSLSEISRLVPGNILQKVFFSTKWAELVEIYKGATNTEKNEIFELLRKIDPTNSTRYEKIKN